jgi:excisionase family DNA binding protein
MAGTAAATHLAALAGEDTATVRETAATLRVSRKTVLRRIAKGEIPASKIGQQYRIPARWLRARVQSGE